MKNKIFSIFLVFLISFNIVFMNSASYVYAAEEEVSQQNVIEEGATVILNKLMEWFGVVYNGADATADFCNYVCQKTGQTLDSVMIDLNTFKSKGIFAIKDFVTGTVDGTWSYISLFKEWVYSLFVQDNEEESKPSGGNSSVSDEKPSDPTYDNNKLSELENIIPNCPYLKWSKNQPIKIDKYFPNTNLSVLPSGSSDENYYNYYKNHGIGACNFFKKNSDSQFWIGYFPSLTEDTTIFIPNFDICADGSGSLTFYLVYKKNCTGFSNIVFSQQNEDYKFYSTFYSVDTDGSISDFNNYAYKGNDTYYNLNSENYYLTFSRDSSFIIHINNFNTVKKYFGDEYYNYCLSNSVGLLYCYDNGTVRISEDKDGKTVNLSINNDIYNPPTDSSSKTDTITQTNSNYKIDDNFVKNLNLVGEHASYDDTGKIVDNGVIDFSGNGGNVALVDDSEPKKDDKVVGGSGDVSSDNPPTVEETVNVYEDDNNKFKLSMLKECFPFCIPFDLYDFFSIFMAEKESPHIECKLDLGIVGVHEINISLEDWEPVSVICRMMFTILFVVGLMFATRKLIKW